MCDEPGGQEVRATQGTKAVGQDESCKGEGADREERQGWGTSPLKDT